MSIELRQERARVLEQAKALLDQVENEGRNLTPAEERRFNELMGGANFLAKKISEAEGRSVPEAWTPDECRQAVADLSKPQGTIAARREQPGDGGPVYSGGEVRALRPEEKLFRGDSNLSLGRLVRGIVTGNWTGADAERRALAEGTDTLGGYLVPEPLSSRVIDLARNQARVVQAGAVTVPMDSSTLKLARVTSDPTAFWRAENTAITPSDMNFGAIELTAKTLAALVKVSVELVEDAANTPSLIENALSQALALELDRAALRGAGAGEPLGIRNWPGVQVIDLGANGAALTDYSKFSEAVQMILEKNGPDSGLAAIYAPRTAGTIDRFVDSTGQPLTPPESFAKLRRLVTNQVPINLTKGTATNASEAYVGAFANCLIGVRTNLTLEVSRQAADSSGSAFRDLQVWIRAYLRADVALARPEHFVVIDGIL